METPQQEKLLIWMVSKLPQAMTSHLNEKLFLSFNRERHADVKISFDKVFFWGEKGDERNA